MTTVDGVDTLSLTDYNRGDDDSLASSTSSGALGPDVGLEPTGRSLRHRQEDRNDGGISHIGKERNNDREAETPPAHPSTSMATETPLTMTGGRTSLVACRIRRLEGGRRRLAGIRRAAAVRRVAVVAKEQRELQLTCDAAALRLATTSFQALLSSLPRGTTEAAKGGHPRKDNVPGATSGVGEEHILALRGRVVQELSGGSSESRGRRGSVQKMVETVRRGSVQIRRGSVQMVERTLKRSGSPARVGARGSNEEIGDCLPPTFGADGTSDGKGNKDGDIDTGEDTCTAIASSLRYDDEGGLPAVENCEKQGAPRPEEGASDALDGRIDIAERQPQDLRQASPFEPEKKAKDRPSQQRTPTRSRRNKDGVGGAEGPSATVSLEELLGAVTDLSQVVDGEGGSVGVAAYTAWWVRAVSDAELELKNRFLNPASLEKWGRRKVE